MLAALAAWSQTAVKLGNGATVKNCIVWGNKDCGANPQLTGTTVITTSCIEGRGTALDADPKFKDAANGLFLLTKESPCINAGTAEEGLLPAATAVDLWGNLRVQGTSIDIGANEYTTYRVKFEKSESIIVENVSDVDSINIDPGSYYKFKVIADIKGLDGIEVNIKVEILDEGGVSLTAVDGVYTLGPITKNHTLKITTDPPCVVTIKAPLNGELTVQGETAKDGTDKSVAVIKNTYLVIDTSAAPGYYCSDVFAKEEDKATEYSVLEHVGKSEEARQYQVDTNVVIRAEYKPFSYPVTATWEGAGNIKVYKKTDHALLLNATVSGQSQQVPYQTDLTVEAVPGTGYELAALTVTSATETDKDILDSKETSVALNGITLKATFIKKKYVVAWNLPANGSITVKQDIAGSPVVQNGVREVEHGNDVIATATPAAGYRLKSFSTLKGGKNGTVIAAVPADGHITVVSDTALKVEFEKQRYEITRSVIDAEKKAVSSAVGSLQITADPASAWVHTTPDSVLHGANLAVKWTPATGYKCDSIRMNDVKQDTTGSRIVWTNLTADQHIEGYFSRKVYKVTYETPEHGTLTVKWKDREGTVFQNIASGSSIKHFDQLEITAVADEGYVLQTLTRNGNAHASGTTAQVDADQEIVAIFVPLTFNVTIEKILAAAVPDAKPDKASVTLKNGSTVLATLSVAENTKMVKDVPYGTVLTIEIAATDPAIYGCAALDTITAKGQGSILSKYSFVVTETVTVKALIKQITDTWKVEWQTKKPAESSSSLVVYKTTIGDLVSGSTDNLHNTTLQVKVTQAAGDTLVSLKLNSADWTYAGAPWTVGTYVLGGNATFVAEFVKKCTIRIVQPPYGIIKVKKDGVVLADGAVVPAKSNLTIEMSVQPGHQDSVRNELLKWQRTAGSVNELWNAGPSKQTVIKTMTLPEAGGEFTFSGETGIYYQVKYTAPQNGSLSVADASGTLPAQVELPKNTALTITAQPNPGYHLIGVYNQAATPEEKLEQFSVTLQKNLDLIARYDINKYTVTIVKEPDAGGSVTVVSSGITLPVTGGKIENVEYNTDLEITATAASSSYELAALLLGNPADNREITSGSTIKITQDTLITARFGSLYRVFYNTAELSVTWKGNLLNTGDGVPEGANLTVTTKEARPGYECKKVEVVNYSDITQVYQSWNREKGDGVNLTKIFQMPSYDVQVNSTTGLKQFPVFFDQPENGILKVFNQTQGQELSNGDLVDYGSTLMATVSAPLVNPTWYKCEKVGYKTGTGAMNWTLKADGSVLFPAGGVNDSVRVEAVMKHQTFKLISAIDPEQAKTEAWMKAKETAATGNLVLLPAPDIKVGEGLDFWFGIPEGWENTAFKVDGVVVPNGSQYTGTNPYHTVMPDHNLNVEANFALKKYLVEIVRQLVTPNQTLANKGGSVTVQNVVPDTAVKSMTQVTHFSRLKVTATPASAGYRLTSLTWNGIEIENGTEQEVTERVKIVATFEKIYEVRYAATTHGHLEIKHGPTVVAEGERHPAGTDFMITAVPDEGYEWVANSLTANGETVPLGNYTVPDNLAIDSIEFGATFALKTYKVTLIKHGPGTFKVEQQSGSTPSIRTVSVDGSPVFAGVEHFTRLRLITTPNAGNNQRILFRINGKNILSADTIVEITGNTTIQAEFSKMVNVVYAQQDHGTIKVTVAGEQTVVPSNTLLPTNTYLRVETELEEGYDCISLTANGQPVVNNTVKLPGDEDAVDEVVIEAVYKIRSYTVDGGVRPEEHGTMTIEKRDPVTGDWSAVTAGETVEHGTEIRVTVAIHEPNYYKWGVLSVNGEEVDWREGVYTMTVTEETFMTARIVPQEFTVNVIQPEHGTIIVSTKNMPVENGGKVPYGTMVMVIVMLDDPDGYEVGNRIANGVPMEGERWKVTEDVTFSTEITLRRWPVTIIVKGNGSLNVLNGTTTVESGDLIEHYTQLAVTPQEEEGFRLYTLTVNGEPLMVNGVPVQGGITGRVQITEATLIQAEFQAREPYKFPVIFTPNGDGINDTWIVNGLWQCPENTLEIYNRQQKRIYKAAPYDNQWDGTTDDGDVLPADTYIYKFTAQPGEVYMGLISIIRK